MGNNSKAKSRAASPWMRLLLRPQNRGLILSVGLLAGAVLSVLLAWQRFGPAAVQSRDFVLLPEAIEVTPQPAWIHSDVKADVVLQGALRQLDLRDPKLVERVARAFALHPWVRNVVRVEKRFPARALVEISYRRPVAVVEWSDSRDQGLLFIDEEGVLLPSADFASSQAKDFLRIGGADKTPAGVGLPWESELVKGAAKLAACWNDQWQALKLYRIVGSISAGGQLVYEIHTANDVRVVWGAAPGQEAKSEPAPNQKIAALVELVQDKGPLDRAGAALLDLRQLGSSRAKAAALPPPKRH
jgi:hypothetical protein